ncbi:MAG: protein-export chaperone SecB [Zetaproteobacteria bacterium]|nr:protein-export chaperone SecB [Pseudobdellovibrionaceae bacterium]|tara:strand:+ start:194 stop:631 length:438 start_codon:yes stop_codon:yes gene_type:complete
MSEMQQPQVGLLRVYLKDLSFESPSAPDIFRAQPQSAMNMNIELHHKDLGEELYEVTLGLNITVKGEKDESIWLVELEQAGIFKVSGIAEGEMKKFLGTWCPNTLFPYARETIDSMVTKGSFPPVMLSPINFDMLYEQQLAKPQS